MCGRFVITSPEALRKLFGYPDRPNFPARFNIAPTQPVPVVILDNGQRRFRLMRWGLGQGPKKIRAGVQRPLRNGSREAGV